jgi:hypothetical protein
VETSRIAAGRARATQAKRTLALSSLAALAVTFGLVRSHVHGTRTSSSGRDSSVSSNFGGEEQQSDDLGGGALSPAPFGAQPQVQSGTS